MSETATMTLTEFLSARLDEDEAVARRCNTGPPMVLALQVGMDHTEGAESGWVEIDPARVLAEVEAKRRIVALHGDGHRMTYGRPDTSAFCPSEPPSLAADAMTGRWRDECDTLLLLALPYADHPDYDPTWAPTEQERP